MHPPKSSHAAAVRSARPILAGGLIGYLAAAALGTICLCLDPAGAAGFAFEPTFRFLALLTAMGTYLGCAAADRIGTRYQAELAYNSGVNFLLALTALNVAGSGLIALVMGWTRAIFVALG
jgi:hypothetical protein